MGNVLCSCCVRKSHTPYDPFIYDQEYDDYISTSVSDNSKVDTYNPPQVIRLEPTNYNDNNNKYYPMSNSVMNVKDNYYNKQQPNKQQQHFSQSPPSYLSQSPTFKPATPSFNNNLQNSTQFDTSKPTMTFSSIHKYYHHSGSFGPNNTANRIVNPTHTQNNIILDNKPNNNTNVIHEEDDSDLYENNNSKTQTPTTINNQDNLDKFYPHYSNVSDSVYMTQPPTSELGINDSIMDSIVLGVNKPITSGPRISFVNNSNLNNNNTTTTTTTTTTSNTNMNQSNYSSEPSSPSNSVYSSVNSSTIESQYFDTKNSFSQ